MACFRQQDDILGTSAISSERERRQGAESARAGCSQDLHASKERRTEASILSAPLTTYEPSQEGSLVDTCGKPDFGASD